MRIIIALLLTGFVATAGTPSDTPPTEFGTITGRVIDGKTRAPLQYANVVVVGTTRGAMVREDGSFTIPNVPPGTYTIKVMMMGYKTVERFRIVMRPESEIKLTFELTQTIVSTTQVINVVGEREKADVGASDTRSSVTQEQVREMPVDDAIDAIALKTGIRKTGDELHARGGRSGEIGVPTKHIPPPPPGGCGRDRSGSACNIRVIRCPQTPCVPRCRPGPGNAESYDDRVDNEFLDAIDTPFSTFSVDVDAASYANMRRFIRGNALPPTAAVRIEEMINYFTYDYPEPGDGHPFSITTEVSECPWNAENRLVHIGLQGKRVSMEEVPPSNLVFLIDVSGSMEPLNKLPLLKASFPLLVDHLRREDRVAIVVYSCSAEVRLESTRGDRKHKILSVIDELEAGGSTAGGAGIRLAYEIAEENFRKHGNNRVILATDGDFNVGLSSDDAMVQLIEEKRERGVYLSVLGFGTGNLKDSKLEKIADKGNGHYAYVDNLLEAKKVLINEMGATLLTIANDVKVQVEFNPAKVEAYRLIGYENRLLEREDFKDDEKDAGELGAGHSVTALYEIVPVREGSNRARRNGTIDDELKYIDVEIKRAAYENPEILTVRFRYKEPDAEGSRPITQDAEGSRPVTKAAEASRLITQIVMDDGTDFEEASGDFRFSAAVAEFGMLLRDSGSKGAACYEHVLRTARAAKGKDEEGYRAEFVQLVEMCRLLTASR